MKKLIATISLGAFIFTSTLVSTGFAADKESTATAKATSSTAENTATNTATSAAAAGEEGYVAVGIIGTAAVAGAILATTGGDDKAAGHDSGHDSGH